MTLTTSDFLALTNDVLQAIIVIFGAAVVLYNLGKSLRNQVIRAFIALVTFVIIVYLIELLVSRTIITQSAELWLRGEWLGITLVPATQFYLSNALLSTTGDISLRRKWFARTGYIIGLVFLGLVLSTDLIVRDFTPLPRAPHLKAGPIFFVFAIYFWLGTFFSVYNVWRARQRCLTSTTRRRMTITLMAFLAAPLAVFPYLVVGGNPESFPWLFWGTVIIGNMMVGTMFALLTSHLIYFGTISPDRVVRVRLFKFMARVPLAGSIVLLVYVLISRGTPILGLSTETALGFALVATIMLVEWAIHAYKRPLERLFQLNDDPDVRRIQQLSERLLTTKDLHQFLESILAATCEALRVPTAFVAAITEDGPHLEAVVGPLVDEIDPIVNPASILEETDLRELAQKSRPPGQNGESDTAVPLQSIDNFIIWQNYWIQPLYNQKQERMLGIFGFRARGDTPDLNEQEKELLARLIEQASIALEDRILQQEVFATVADLLPEITALQERRGAATFSALPVLTAPPLAELEGETLVDDPEFSSMVRDALSHYWGGPKLTQSPLMRLEIVQRAMHEQDNPANALRSILADAIALQKPEGERSMTTAEWILYNILELKFVQGKRVRDVARRLAMSESDLYRKQRVAIENVAQTVAVMEEAARDEKLL